MSCFRPRGAAGSAEATLRLRLGLIADLPISVDQETAATIVARDSVLARAEALTAYDAAYLELAVRRSLPLMTKDGELAGAAKRLGVVVFPVIDRRGRPRAYLWDRGGRDEVRHLL